MTMTARAALTGGLHAAFGRPRLVLGLFAANLLWSLAWTWPLYATLFDATALRPYAGPLAHGMQIDVLAEIVHHDPAILASGRAGVLAGAVGWIALSWLLCAGVLGVLREPTGRGGLGTFATEAAGRAARMAAIQFWSLLPYAAALALALGGGLAGAWLAGKGSRPWAAIGLGALLALPGLALALLTATAVDLARAQASLEPPSNRPGWARRALMTGFSRLRRQPRLMVGIQAGGGLLWLLAGALYLCVSWPFAFASLPAFILLLALRQALVLARTTFRIATLSATLEVAREPSAGPLPTAQSLRSA